METLIVAGYRDGDEVGFGWLEVMDKDGYVFLHPVDRENPAWALFVEDLDAGKHPVVQVEPWALSSWTANAT